MEYRQTAKHILDNCYLVAKSKNFYEDDTIIENLAKNTLSVLEKYLQENNIDYPKNFRIKVRVFDIMKVYGRVLHYEDLFTRLKDIKSHPFLCDKEDIKKETTDKLQIAQKKLVETYLEFKSYVSTL